MQPWPGEVLEERAGEIAVGFAALLTRQAAWRHRRVETIEVLSHEQVRRSVSVDFTVPREHRAELALGDGQWVVPLAVLDKRKLVHFDLLGEDGYALPLMRSDEVQLIARELLYMVLDIDLEGAELDVDMDDLIERVLAAGPDDGPVMNARVAEVAARAPEFAALATTLTSGFLLCAVLTDVSRRRVVKFAYDEPLGHPDRFSHFYGTQGCSEAASYHVELAVPDGMRARSADIVDNRSGDLLLEGPRDSDRPGLHYVAGAETSAEPGLSVRYATERGGFLVPAMLVAWVIALELGLAFLFADLHGIATTGGPAVAVLLSISAVFSSLVLRAGEHPLVQLVLAPYRMLLALATIAAVLAGAVLAFRGSATLLDVTWGVGAVVAVLAAGILSIEVARAPATAKRP
ncbi:hypothetical protein OJ997_25015 [Solirubrobacter phytolaccae]|uniref:Uncharacterized protein n=1 Tax=Solirubrobacter phytolaccae TaxID=1404360 RepID=A0A9X3NE79_9ACTN|nr:hypothetical protein [Solirubrobacter phytolaccae]MDA0183594.1 hypothetical protein [Solirubrobacter phytolaccae]